MFNTKMLIVCFATAVLGRLEKIHQLHANQMCYFSLLRINFRVIWSYILGRTTVPA